MTHPHLTRRRVRRGAAAVLFAAGVAASAFTVAGAADGSVAVTAASDTSVSASDAQGSYAGVAPIVVTETAPGVITPGSVVIAAPPGFEFGPSTVTISDRMAGVDAITLSATPDCATTGTVSTIPLSAEFSFHVCAPSAGAVPADLVVEGITVRATQPTPLATGNIHVAASTTAGLPGVVTGPDGTSLGRLVEQPGPAAVLVITTPASATAGVATSVDVEARDAYGNTASGYGGTVALTSTDAGATIPAPHAFTPGDAGRYTFSGVVLRRAGVTSLVVADVADPAVVPAHAAIAVAPGDAATLAVMGGGETTAGSPVTIVVRAEDAFGNVATGYRGTVTFGASDPQASLPGAYTFTADDAGSHPFDVVLRTAGAQAITALDVTAGIAGSQGSFVVVAAPAQRLEILGIPDALVAGTSVPATLAAFDEFGNRATGYRGTVRMTATDPLALLPGDVTFTSADAGVRDVPGVVLRTAGWHLVTAADTVDPTVIGTRSGIVVSPAPTLQFVIDMPATAVAGIPSPVVVTPVDAYGNATPDYGGTVTMTATDPRAAMPAPHAFSAADVGGWAADVQFGTAGTQSIVVTDGAAGIAATGPPVAVRSGSPASIALIVSPADVIADGVSTATATALVTDGFGNAVPDDAVFFVTDGDIAVGLTVTNHGDGTYSTTLTASTTAGTETITATDGANATTAVLVEHAGPAVALGTELAVTTAVTGSPVAMTVTAHDTFGNVATDYAGTVHFTSSDPLASLPGDYTFAPGDRGTHTFDSGVTFETAGFQTVTVVDVANSALTGQTAPTKVLLDTLLTLMTSGSTVTFPPVTLDGDDQHADGALDTVRIVDNRTIAAGWSVTATMSDLTVGGDPRATGRRRLPARNVTWDPSANGGCHAVDGDGDGVIDGNDADVVTGPGGLADDATSGVALDPMAPSSLCVATPGAGLGAFESRAALRLRIPASAAAGTYTGVLTITVS